MIWNTFDIIPKFEGFYLVCNNNEPEPVSWHSKVIFFDMKHDAHGEWFINEDDFVGEPTHWARIAEFL